MRDLHAWILAVVFGATLLAIGVAQSRHAPREIERARMLAPTYEGGREVE